MAQSFTLSRLWIVFVLAALFAGLSAAGAHMYVTDLREAEAERERLRIQAEYDADLKEVQALFDTYLNNFIRDLKAAMRDYRSDRKMLPRMIAAYNFETPDYAKENYTVFVQDVSPGLSLKASDVLAIFDEYDKKLSAALGDRNDEIAQTFTAQWKEMSEEQLSVYVDYFVREDALLGAYEDLMRFYVRYANLYTIHPEDEVFVFKRPEDEEKHLLLLEKLGAASALASQ